MALHSTFKHAANDSAAVVGQAVMFFISIRNTGLLTLFDANVHSVYLEGRGSTISCLTDPTRNSTVVASSGGVVSEMMPYPDGGLPPGGSIECSASVELLQSEVRRTEIKVEPVQMLYTMVHVAHHPRGKISHSEISIEIISFRGVA